MPRFARTRGLLVVAFVLALAACGFQLRGSANLPDAMATTWIEAPASSRELADELALLLAGNGVELVDGPEAAGARLAIVSARLDRVVQSVGASARVREFALVYRVAYRIDATAGEALVPTTELVIRRDYTFDERQVLGTTSEQELREREMRREMATRIVANVSAR